MTIKDIGKLLKEIEPEAFHKNKSNDHIGSIVLASSYLKSIGDALSKHSGNQKGNGVSVPGGSIHKKKGENILRKNLKHFSKMLLNKTGSGVTKTNLKDIIKKLDKIKVTAKDIFGPDYIHKGRMLIEKLKQFHANSKGGNIFKDIKNKVKKGTESIGKMTKKSISKLDQFMKGKTKLKPSQLLSYTAGGLGIIAGIATLQPELIGVSAGVISGISGVTGGVSSVLRTSGRGRGIPREAQLFMNNHPEKAKKIKMLLLKENKKGKGLSKKTKNILKMAGATALVGAKAYFDYLKYKNAGMNQNQPEFGVDYGPNWDAEDLPLNFDGEGINEIKSFIKKNKKKALSILLGVATTGAMIAGESLFRNKYGGIASYSKDGQNILKHLLSGSNKKLDLGDVILQGNKVILGGKYQSHKPHLSGYGLKPPSGGSNKKFTNAMAKFIKLYPKESLEIINFIDDKLKISSGNGMEGSGVFKSVYKQLKNILSMVGVLGIVGALAFAKYYLNIKENRSDEHNRAFVSSIRYIIEHMTRDANISISDIVKRIEGSGLRPAGKSGEGIRILPKYIRDFIQKHRTEAMMIAKEVDTAYQSGEGALGRLAGVLSVAGMSASLGALAFREYLIKNPGKAAKILASGVSSSLMGMGMKKKRIGTKHDVYHGICKCTSGGLYKKDLKINKRGKVVSIKQSENGKKRIENLRRKATY